MNLSIQDTEQQDCKKVYYNNGVYLGDFVLNDDGYWVYFPERHNGYWDEYLLFLLYTKLQEMNEPWDQQLQKECKHPNFNEEDGCPDCGYYAK